MNTTDSRRAELEVLLPWHAAGTLGRQDAARVERAMARDPELARRFRLAGEELNETIGLNETLGAPSARAMERLFADIDAEPARRPQTSFEHAGRMAVFLSSFSPRSLAWSGFAAILAIALLGGVRATYHGAELAGFPAKDSALAELRFAPDAKAIDITNFLEVNKVEVIGGPKSSGFYIIRLPAKGEAKDDLIKQMQAQTAIVGLIASVQ